MFLNSSLSWTTASLLITASFAEITRSSKNELTQKWVYALVMFAVSILVILPFYFFESSDVLAKELELTVPLKMIALGDEDEIQKDNVKRNTAMNKNVDQTPNGNANRFLNFMELEVNYVLKNLETLVIGMFSIATSRALNDAVMEIYKDKVKLRVELSRLWLYAFIVGWITLGISMKSGHWLDKTSIKLSKELKENGMDKQKGNLLAYGTTKRVINVITTTWNYVWAFSLRDAMKASVMGIYGGNENDQTINALWTYTIISTLIVALGNAVSERF